MTDFEKQQINELRIKGVGYKAIANILGLSRDIVRGYCRRNGLEGDAFLVSLNLQEKKKNQFICSYCHKELKQKHRGRNRRFCSEECRRKWWNLNQDKRTQNEKSIYKYTCPNCGAEFSCYGNKKRKYCSHDCYIKWRFGKEEKNGV